MIGRRFVGGPASDKHLDHRCRSFEKAADKASGRVVKAYCLYVLGRVQHRLGLVHPARGSLLASLRENDTVDCRLQLVQLLLGQDDVRAAKLQLQQARMVAERTHDSEALERVEKMAREIEALAPLVPPEDDRKPDLE